MSIEIGDLLCDFSLKDQDGEMVSREDLIGSPFVLYFYPKDDTPGCTTEACSFRDEMSAFDSQDIVVVGVSGDSEKSHHNFAEKHSLNFPLLSDPSFILANALGALKENGGKKSIERSTFFFDEEGVLVWKEQPVKVDGHVGRVLEMISSLYE